MVGTRHEHLGKFQTALERNYAPSPLPDRPLLEHLLYAACLEDSSFEAADESLAKLQEFFIDWNEVRVSTVTELSGVLTGLTDPVAAGRRLKSTLQSVFEHGLLGQTYTFDLEYLRKEKQATIVEAVGKLMGVSPFMVGYFVQQGLGGHSIPLDRAAIRLGRCLGLVKEPAGGEGEPTIPSLERAVAKADGPEFFTRFHRAGVECLTGQMTAALKKLFKDVHPAGLAQATALHEEDRAAAASGRASEAGGPKASAKPRPAAPGASGGGASGTGPAGKSARPKTEARPAEPASPSASDAGAGGKRRSRTPLEGTSPAPAAEPGEPADKPKRRPAASDGPTPRPSRKRLAPPEAETGAAPPVEPPTPPVGPPRAAAKTSKTAGRRKPR